MRFTPSSDRPPLRRHLKLAAILFLVLVAVSVMGNRGLVRLYQMQRDKTTLEREIDRLSAANAALAGEVQALRTDPGRVEGIAREELGLVKPGELVFEFQASPRPQPPASGR